MAFKSRLNHLVFAELNNFRSIISEMAAVTVDWLQAHLAKLLQFPDTEDIAR